MMENTQDAAQPTPTVDFSAGLPGKLANEFAP